MASRGIRSLRDNVPSGDGTPRDTTHDVSVSEITLPGALPGPGLCRVPASNATRGLRLIGL